MIGASAQYRGFGLFEKTGASTWTLIGTTTAVTPWTLTGGTLSIAQDSSLGDSTSALAFNGGTLLTTASFTMNRAVALNASGGTIETDAGTVLTSAGGIAGSGGLTKTGTGTLALSSANTYAGATSIEAGTLKGVAGNAFSAASAHTVASGATLDLGGFNQAVGSLAGAGAVTNSGVAAATLNTGGDNTSTLFSGILQNGAAATTLAKSGSGMLTLSGDSSAFSGTTNVRSGILSVNGSLGGTMDVLSDGTLQGNGAVGVTTVQAGGIIAPGNSIGVLHVNGSYTQQAGSTYQVQLDPTSTTSDLIAVNGPAMVQPGSLLSASKSSPGTFTPNTTYKVLNASGGVTGTYTLAGDIAVSAFLNLVDSYDANNVYLKVVQTRDIGDAAQTPNQTSTAGGLGGTPLENPVLNSPSDAAARDAFDQLSGAGHASVKGAMIYDSRYARALAIDRLRDAFCTVGHSSRRDGAVRPGEPIAASGCAVNPDRFAVWGQAFGSWGHSNGNANAARIVRSSGGFVTGIDVAMADNWRIGLLTGYSRSNFSVDAQRALSGSDNYHFGVYGGTQRGNLAFRFGSTYTWHDITSSRSVALPGFFNRLSADYSASTAQVFGELGYQIEAGQFGFEPFANLAYVNLHSNGFVERGGAAALTSRGGDTGTAFTTLGLRASTDFALGNVRTTARGTLGWLHAYGDLTSVSVMSFAGGNPFIVTGVPIATDAAVVEAGLDLHVTRQATLGISYGGQFGGAVTDQSVRGNFTMRF